MKHDKAILVAVLVLIGLVSWLLVISLQKSKQSAQLIEKVEQSQTKEPDKIDYDRISMIIKEQIASEVAAIPSPKDGLNGKDGAVSNGLNGKDGKNGPDGKSVYDLWIDAGNTGTPDDFLKSLKGEKGDTLVPSICSDKSPVPLKMKFPNDIFWQLVPDCQGVN